MAEGAEIDDLEIEETEEQQPATEAKPPAKPERDWREMYFQERGRRKVAELDLLRKEHGLSEEDLTEEDVKGLDLAAARKLLSKISLKPSKDTDTQAAPEEKGQGTKVPEGITRIQQATPPVAPAADGLLEVSSVEALKKVKQGEWSDQQYKQYLAAKQAAGLL